ncbi:MAG: cytochrome c [Gammaproteobacteria bacterium]|nr:cytochrome c [Gammaproteobacteria bacterium]
MILARICLGVFVATAAIAASGAGESRQEELADVRGSIVFRTYCVLCHGPHADGEGRAAKNLMPPPANLTVSAASDEYKERIIRNGGAAVERSPFMPPWGQELTDEQIHDVIAYLRVININHRPVMSAPAPK